MLAPERAAVRVSGPRRVIFSRTRFVALPLSIVLHVLVLYIVGRTSWTTVPEVEREQPGVLWLSDWLPPDQEPVAGPPEEPEAQAAVPEMPPAPEPQAIVEEPPTEAVPEEPPTEAEDEEPAPAADGPDTDPRPAEETTTEETASRPRIVVWEEARRHVIERMREQRERDAGYRTFSPDDGREEPQLAEPGPDAPIFERCPVVSSRGRQLAMMMMGLCFRTEARNDLFAHLKPDYLKGRPVCEPVTDANGNETFKCRLVIDEE